MYKAKADSFNHYGIVRCDEVHFKCGGTEHEYPIHPDNFIIRDFGIYTECYTCTELNKGRPSIVKMHLSADHEREFHELFCKATIMKWGAKLPQNIPYKYIEKAFERGIKKDDVMHFAQDAFSCDKPRNDSPTIFNMNPPAKRVHFIDN
jgi:hypothetical protein